MSTIVHTFNIWKIFCTTIELVEAEICQLMNEMSSFYQTFVGKGLNTEISECILNMEANFFINEQEYKGNLDYY